MILVVGASGRLGGTIARHLLIQGARVRVLTRTPAKLENLKALGAEVVGGDMRDPLQLTWMKEFIQTRYASSALQQPGMAEAGSEV